MANEWIDITVPIENGMVAWPGDEGVCLERFQDMERGDRKTQSRLAMGCHRGTHVDAPLHFLKGARGIEALPWEALMGPARVLEIKDPEAIKEKELKSCSLKKGERILFKTRNSAEDWATKPFDKTYVSLSQSSADFLAASGIQTVGVDALSIGGFKEDRAKIHAAIFKAGICVLEGLDLSRVSPGLYELLCLPLKIKGGDGAPARALLRKINS